MPAESVVRIVQEGLLLVLLLSAPGVLAALLVGLCVSIFQAATQLQEQTLTIAPKIVAVYVTLGVMGLWMLRELLAFGGQLLGHIEAIGR